METSASTTWTTTPPTPPVTGGKQISLRAVLVGAVGRGERKGQRGAVLGGLLIGLDLMNMTLLEFVSFTVALPFSQGKKQSGFGVRGLSSLVNLEQFNTLHTLQQTQTQPTKDVFITSLPPPRRRRQPDRGGLQRERRGHLGREMHPP